MTIKKKTTTRKIPNVFRMTTRKKIVVVKGRSSSNANLFIPNEVPFSKLKVKLILPFNNQKRQSGGAPGNETLAMFTMTDAQLNNITQQQQQNDCVVNSLRSINAIDAPTENMLRGMLVHHPTGIQSQLMEYILNLSQLGRYIFRFRDTNDWNVFTNHITTMTANTAIICGFTNQAGQSHVCLIAKNKQGQYAKIDSHVNPAVCTIVPGSNCLQQMLPPGIQGATRYYIMAAIEL